MSDFNTLIDQRVQQAITTLLPQIAQAVAQQLQGGAQAQQAPQNNGFGGANAGQGFGQQQANTGNPNFQQPNALGAQTSGNFGQNTTNQFGQQPVTHQQPAQNVTPEAIQNLITPLVANEATKAQLLQQLAEMGIAQLGDARPDQLPELYQRFSRIAQAAGSGGIAAGGGSII